MKSIVNFLGFLELVLLQKQAADTSGRQWNSILSFMNRSYSTFHTWHWTTSKRMQDGEQLYDTIFIRLSVSFFCFIQHLNTVISNSQLYQWTSSHNHAKNDNKAWCCLLKWKTIPRNRLRRSINLFPITTFLHSF